MQINSKLPNIGTTIFTIMSALANEHQAVNLGQGFPDFPMDQQLTDLVNKAMKDGYNQYTHSNGLPALREAISKKVKNLYQSKINPETQITITPGATYAIYTALTSMLHAGDEVILFEPAYDSYIPNIEINGAKAILIPLTFPNYEIPWDLVRSKITSKTKMIMINSPHNPTGCILKENDIQELIKITQNTNILILSDEVYEHLIFDQQKHLSLLNYLELLERSFICFSFGKTYHCTGWKLGYCISGELLMSEFRKVHQFNAFTCDTPKQIALAEYLENTNAYLNLGSTIQIKRDYLRKLMSETEFKCIPSFGSYFECYSYANITDEDDLSFAKRLTKDFKIATIPVSAFYKDKTDHKVLRFCFAKKEETLDRAIEGLMKLK